MPTNFDPRTAPVHEQLAIALKSSWKEEYAHQLEEKASEVVNVRVGHSYMRLCNAAIGNATVCAHRWRVFVEQDQIQEDLIDKVSFGRPREATVFSYGSTRLDYEDLRSLPNELLVEDGPFQITATSWKTTTVDITIFFKQGLKQQPLHLQHFVDFSGDAQTEQTETHTVHLGITSNALREAAKADESDGETSTGSDTIAAQPSAPHWGGQQPASSGSRISSPEWILPPSTPPRRRGLSLSRIRSSLRSGVTKLTPKSSMSSLRTNRYGRRPLG